MAVNEELAVTFPVDSILRRKEPQGDKFDELIVTAVDEKTIVESNIEFTGPFDLDAVEINELYNVTFPEGYDPDAIAVQKRPSPEQVFANEAKNEYEATKIASATQVPVEAVKVKPAARKTTAPKKTQTVTEVTQIND
jgi:hypothetical protein